MPTPSTPRRTRASPKPKQPKTTQASYDNPGWDSPRELVGPGSPYGPAIEDGQAAAPVGKPKTRSK